MECWSVAQKDVDPNIGTSHLSGPVSLLQNSTTPTLLPRVESLPPLRASFYYVMTPGADERTTLKQELKRLRAKQAEVKDKDIKKALALSIEAFEEKLAKLEATAGPTPEIEQEPEIDPEAMRAQLESDIKRLKVKQSAVGDRDMEEALGLQIQAVQKQLANLQPIAEPEPEVELVPPTPDQQEEADRLVQRAQLEKRRGNAALASDLLAEASRIAPTSATVLELLGDELSDQRKHQEAIAVYDKARKLDPKNLSVDKKHANLVFQSKAAPAGAVLSIGEYDAMIGNRKWAVWLNLLPGLGQIVLTQYVKGAIYMGLWLLMLLWILVRMPDCLGLIVNAGTFLNLSLHFKSANLQYSPTIFIPIIAAALVHMAALLAFKSSSTDVGPMMVSATPKGKPDRPILPAVNLPFE